jgi:transposase
MKKLLRQLQAKRTQLVVVSAAGPCGDWLSRSLRKTGAVCWGVAPCLMPQKPGDRVTPDRRDARPRARLRRSGDLTPVYVPAIDDEAMRALSRAREETLRARKAAQFRRTAFVLRHAIRDTGRANGRPAHLRGRRAVGCPTPAQHMVLQADVQTVTAQTERWGRRELALHEQGHTWRFSPVVEALQAVRSVQCTVAVTTVAALGDLTRVEHPPQRMHELGLTPAASARGGRRQQGSRTKTGNAHARRALGAGAWAYRSPAHGRRHRQRRLAKLPAASQASSWQAQVRLCPRDRPLMATGKHAPQVVGAMARAWRAFLWAMATPMAVTPKAYRRLRVAAQARHGAHVPRQRRRPGVVSPSAALGDR